MRGGWEEGCSCPSEGSVLLSLSAVEGGASVRRPAEAVCGRLWFRRPVWGAAVKHWKCCRHDASPSSRCEHAHPTTCVFSWGWPSLLPPSSLPVWQPVWRQAWAVLSGPPRGRAARLPHLLFVPGCCDRSQPRAFVGSSQSKILPMPRGPLLKPEAKGPWLSLQKGFVEARLAPKMCPWHGGPPGGPLAP